MEYIIWRRMRMAPITPVSISALSDRGMHPSQLYSPGSKWHDVSISALSDRGMHPTSNAYRKQGAACFNIRSFGSWNASGSINSWDLVAPKFQYPLFRIVECIGRQRARLHDQEQVSISALSDRGMHPITTGRTRSACQLFQYPLFRIVECIPAQWRPSPRCRPVSISALSDRGMHRK